MRMADHKDYLSQEEIDALLKQTGLEEEEGTAFSSDHRNDINDYLNSLEQDALGEIGNITFGSAATALSTLLGRKVEITTPKVSIIAKDEIEKEFPHPHVSVHVKYIQGFQGVNLLVFKEDDAKVIADLMLGGDGSGMIDELNDIHTSAVQEAMNQMMGSSATSMSTIFNRMVNISPPAIRILKVSERMGTDTLPEEEVFIKISFRLKIEPLIDSSIMQLISVPFAKEMISILMGGSDAQEDFGKGDKEPEKAAAKPIKPSTNPQHESANPMQNHQTGPSKQEPVHQQYQQASNADQPMYQQPMHPPQYQQPSYQQQAYHQPNRNINVQPVQFDNFTNVPSVHAENTNLNLLLDIPLKVTVELGRTQKMIRDILELSQGSIIELDKLAGEPVDILVNNKLVAKGEVVVIDENFGVRVTDIISQMDRIQKLK
jgi:flagellar motor switch protein FliN/FliY